MKRIAVPSLLVLIVASWMLAAFDPKPEAKKLELNGQPFTLPPGFEIELVAGPPLVARPISAAFDEQGRLYVTESLGSNDKIDVQQEKKPYRILRLESTKGDGHFDKRTVFVDKIMFTEGAMWYDGSLYVAAPPSIWKLTDTKGDGVADQRVEWFQGKTVTSCANDLHGPYLGPDGWIYWCKGAFAKQTYERPGKPPFVTRAAHVFRCRPDGNGLEPVMTGGMDNPVGVAFTPGGERIITTTFLQHPADGKRDGLIHAVYGGIYGKDHDVIYDPVHKWTSPALMSAMTHLGPAAPCALIRYDSEVFGKDFRDNLFVCQFNLHKVSRHVLKPDGAFVTRDEDFVVSGNVDFHPTDVIEDADGSLLVVDTGGWYKLCCPSSQFHKPDIFGGIYRIRKKDAAKVADPRGLKVKWEELPAKELVKYLDDPRPAVRRRAMELLPKLGEHAVDALENIIKSSPSADARRNAVWTATRIDGNEAGYAVYLALSDKDEVVRQAALHSIAVRHYDATGTLGIMAQIDPSLQNRRVAAEALARLSDKEGVQPLFWAVEKTTDRFLEHSLIYALIEIADRDGTAKYVKNNNPKIRRAALIALDQMDGGNLDAAAVTPNLTAKDLPLREAADWIAGRHPEWADEMVGHFRTRLAAKQLSDAEWMDLVRQLARFAKSPAIQRLLADRLRADGATMDERFIALQAMAQAGLKEAPPAWLDAVADTLATEREDLTTEGVTTARTVVGPNQRSDRLATALLRIANRENAPATLRLKALAAVPGGLAEVKPPTFAFLLEHTDREQTVAQRSLAADVLSHAVLSTDQLLALADALKNVGPMEVDRLLEAFKQSTDERIGLHVVAALDASPIRTSLRVEMIKPRLAKYSAPVQGKAEALYAVIDADAAMQKEHLEKLLASLEKGDVQRGQQIFNSQKTACIACHTVGYVGGKIGPDLTKVGSIRTERDLLESIVYPSASFVRSYEPVEVLTKRGKTYNGVVRKEGLDEIVLALDATNEVRIARADIDDMKPSKVSIMPAGLDKQLTPRELADLVAFLKACK